MAETDPPVLWSHPSPHTTTMHAFKTHISQKYSLTFTPETTPASSLQRWSTENPSLFWSEIWHFTNIVASAPYHTVVDETLPMFPRPAWFEGARLNFAENLLWPRAGPGEGEVAVVEVTEAGVGVEVTWAELRGRVGALVGALRGRVKVGERVVGYVANHADALVAMLAATSLGCIWSGVSPDHGTTAVLDRLQQLRPTVLFADAAVLYNGKLHTVAHKLPAIVEALPTLTTVVLIDHFAQDVDTAPFKPVNGEVFRLPEFLATAEEEGRGGKFEFAQLPPDHPVYILFSSGTTGKPKAIVHGAIGTLLQHKKEHHLHCSLGPTSTFLQFTTVSWMMWHWHISSLSSGARIVLYDGSPFHPHGNHTLPLLIAQLGITHFGTSAKYLSILEQAATIPVPMPTLQAVYSTAAVLAPSTYEYVYDAFGQVNLASITGGTDIVSLFGAPSPLSPVRAGEIQCIGLGMAVEAWDTDGKRVPEGEPGDLVCTKAFPCMPVGFWGEGGEEAYRRSYFEAFPGVVVWCHGDFVKLGAEGSMAVLGRSDGVLKPGGVRFGSAEIYNILLAHFPAEIEDALCIGRRRPTDTDEQVVLFVKLAATHTPLSPKLVADIKAAVRCDLTARHVPAVVDECFEIPVTTNGKKVEVAVKQILCGFDVRVSASVRNVECLEWYREWAGRN